MRCDVEPTVGRSAHRSEVFVPVDAAEQRSLPSRRHLEMDADIPFTKTDMSVATLGKSLRFFTMTIEHRTNLKDVKNG